MPAVAKKSAYTIDKLTDGASIYIGITTQALSTRLRQHKQDAKLDGSCAITAKLCQKKAPKDLTPFPHRGFEWRVPFPRLSVHRRFLGSYWELEGHQHGFGKLSASCTHGIM